MWVQGGGGEARLSGHSSPAAPANIVLNLAPLQVGLAVTEQGFSHILRLQTFQDENMVAPFILFLSYATER